MKIMLLSVPALALCIAAPAAINASTPAQPNPSAAQYQGQDQGQYQDRGRDQDDWGRPPEGYRDAQRRGFHEGVEAARRDAQNGRHPDADDHQVYKHPPVEGDDARHDFREGFKEGYRRAMEHMRRDQNYQQPHF